MRVSPMISLIFCLVTFAFATESLGKSAGGVIPTYELYSWQDSNGAWNFSLLYTTNRQKTVEEVFNEKTALHGVDKLKRRISKLPKSSRVVWFDRLTLGGVRVEGSESLKYPPKEIVDELKRYSDAHAIKLFGPRR